MGFENEIFQITPEAININDTRPLHVVQLVRDALRNMGKIVAATPITILGVSYREDVGDTRYSGSEIVLRKLTEMGAEVRAHDPYVEHWWEIEKQDSYPASGMSLSRFFRNQQELDDFSMTRELSEALSNTEAVVLAVRHAPYLTLTPDDICRMAGGPIAIVDCFGILTDGQIQRYFELGCEVKALGRGHVKRIKDAVRKSNTD